MTESDRTRYKVEDLLLPFIPGSSAERWILSAEPEETSLILGELCDLYGGLSGLSRSKLPKKQLSNVVGLIIMDLNSHDNSLRLNGLKLLKLITEDHSDIIGQYLTQIAALIQDFLQDNSRVIRHSALKLIAELVIKLPFYLTAPHIVTMLESTYQYHEYCLKAASLAILRFLDECQSTLTLRSRIIQQETTVVSFARYSIALLQHSTSNVVKPSSSVNKSKHASDDADSSDGGLELIDGLYDAHDAALDLLALSSFSLPTIDSCKGGGNYSLLHLRQVSCSALLHHIIDVADVGSLHKNSQSEIVQRMKMFNFPSLSDDEITEISQEIMLELLKASQDDFTEMQRVFSNMKINSHELASVFSSSMKLATASSPNDASVDEIALRKSSSRANISSDLEIKDDEASLASSLSKLRIDHEEDEPKLSSIKGKVFGSRVSLQRSFSLGEKSEATGTNVTTESTPAKSTRVVQSADPIHRSEVVSTDNEQVYCHPPLTASKFPVFCEEDHNSQTPFKEHLSEEGKSRNYSRAASSRLKRSRLKQPPSHLQLDNSLVGVEKPELHVHGEIILDQADVVHAEPMTPVRSKPIISFDPPMDDQMAPMEATPKRRANHSTIRKKVRLGLEISNDNESSQTLEKDKNEESSGMILESEHALPSGLKPDTVEYTCTKDLTPMKNPNQEFPKVLRGLESQDWSDLFQTLNNLRRVVIHHPQVVIPTGSLHAIVMLVMKLVDNLRSSLAKNALITVADLFLGLKKAMDSEILTVLPGVLKRSADSSNFLGESADRVLENMVDHSTAIRTLVALLGFADHKTAGIRAKVAGCLLLLLQRRCEELQGQREIDGLKSKLSKLLQDQSPETRSHAREIARFLLNSAGVTRSDLEAFVSAEIIEKVLKDKLSLTTSFYSPLRGVSSFSSSTMERSFDEEAQGFAVVRKSSPHLMQTGNNHEDFDDIKQYSHSSGDYRRRQSNAENTPSRPSRRKMMAEQASHDEVLLSPSRCTAPAVVHSPRQVDSLSSPNARKQKKYGVPNNASASTAAKRILEGDPELMQWQNTLITISNTKNWVEKKDALTALTNMLIKYYSVLRDVSKLETCLDGLLERLNDGSIKIVGHTLDCLERIMVEEPAALQTNVLQIVAPRFLSAIASTNKQVSSRSMALLTGVLSTVSSVQVVQYLCSVAEFDKDKARISAIKVLIEMTDHYCSDPDFLISGVKKVIFSTTCRVLFSESSKVDIRLVCGELLKTIQCHIRHDRIYKWADSPHHQEEIKRITATS